MLKKSESKQMKMSFVTLESLMPQEHFLRDLDRLVDFDFIYDKVADLYSNTGRPSIDPVVMIKMLLIGYIYGIDSERRLEQEITVNIAYRWFLGIDLDERVPDHSTFSQLRRRKFDGTTVFRDIFDEVVRKCIETGLIDGKLLLTDSTHIRANACNDLREIIEVPDAIKLDILNYNPCQKVTVPRNIKNRTNAGKEKKIYTKEQARELLKMLSESTMMFRVYFTLCMFTGCRRGELLGLEWKDFDYIPYGRTDEISLLERIKQAFRSVHIYINSDTEKDAEIIKQRFYGWRLRQSQSVIAQK